jgi:uncharacterized protein
MHQRSLRAFFVLTFTITWGIAALLLLFPIQMTAWFGAMSAYNPLFRLAVFAPTITAIVVTISTEGLTGLRPLLSRLVRWRFGLQWYLFLLVGIPILGLCAAILGNGTPTITLDSWYLFIPVLISQIYLDPGPLGEELGWRGYALPRLLERHNTLSASLRLGVIWFIWHLPAFLIGGSPQIGLSLPAFLLSALALSILATWLYNNTQGSVLPSVLLHLTANFALNVLDAPLILFSSLLGMTALIVVVATRETQLSSKLT